MMPREKLQTSALPKIDSDRLTKLQSKESLTADVLIFIRGKNVKIFIVAIRHPRKNEGKRKNRTRLVSLAIDCTVQKLLSNAAKLKNYKTPNLISKILRKEKQMLETCMCHFF